MANKVSARFHRPLPGGGFDSAGTAKQGKVEVRGKISVTTYSKSGESLKASDLGLLTIDWIDIKHENAAAGKEGREAREVRYNWSDQEFYILVGENPENAGSHTLYFNAFGDTARETELI